MTDVPKNNNSEDEKPKFNFQRWKQDWLTSVASDKKLRAVDYRHVMIVSKYLNRNTLEAWPGILTLARLLEVGERTIRRSRDRIAAAGHWAVVRSKRGKLWNANRLKPIIKTAANVEGAESIGAEYFRLAREHYGLRGVSIIGKAREEGWPDAEILEKVREAIEAGEDVDTLAHSFWTPE